MRTNLSEQFDEAQRKAWKPKIIARNTFRFERDGETVIRLHATDIARKMPDGSVILNSGGWKTVTTKDRMNSALLAGYSLCQEKGAWFIVQHVNGGWRDGARVPYFDGIQVPQCFSGKPGKGAKVAAQEEKLRKQIRKFVSKLDGMKCLPDPSAGDCLYCQLQTRDGKNLGEATGNSEHIRLHVAEGYLHGSLLWNALKWAGYRQPEFIWQLENSDRQQGRKLHNGGNVKRALKRYLYRQCGLVS